MNHDAVKLFWEGKTDNPNHLVTTDWGALDAYHDPSRHKGSNFGGYKPTEWTLDAVESPRNSAWFPCAFAARRAVTFLEQQPVVDANWLGVYGHSMGGKLSVLGAGSDGRVKAVAPSCGGISHREIKSPLDAALNDNNYLENIACPIIFLSPSNDFHGRRGGNQKLPNGDWPSRRTTTTRTPPNTRSLPVFLGLLWDLTLPKISRCIAYSPKSSGWPGVAFFGGSRPIFR